MGQCSMTADDFVPMFNSKSPLFSAKYTYVKATTRTIQAINNLTRQSKISLVVPFMSDGLQVPPITWTTYPMNSLRYALRFVSDSIQQVIYDPVRSYGTNHIERLRDSDLILFLVCKYSTVVERTPLEDLEFIRSLRQAILVDLRRQHFHALYLQTGMLQASSLTPEYPPMVVLRMGMTDLATDPTWLDPGHLTDIIDCFPCSALTVSALSAKLKELVTRLSSGESAPQSVEFVLKWPHS